MRPLLPLAVLIFGATLASGSDVSGKWSGYSGSLVMKQEGSILTGTVEQSATETYPIENGNIAGDRLSFQLGPLRAELHVEGETIRGTFITGERSTNVIFKRLDEGAPPPAFDVASIKRAAPATGGGSSSSSHTTRGRFTCTNVSLKGLLLRAYKLHEYQVMGPAWFESERYDIVATFPPDTPNERIPLMLQALLAEQLKVTVHRETKELPVYALVVDKPGLKLASAPPFSGGVNSQSGSKGSKLTGNMSLNTLADSLGNGMDRPVVDLTGIKGVFAIQLEWMPEDTRAVLKPSESSIVTDPEDKPSIYATLHKLGLKLESRKGPVAILVLDSAERVPVEN